MNSEPPKPPTVVIFMGVAGSGKTTVAALFAKKTGAAFYEGDQYHSPENIAKMRSGVPLTDADREPWLATLRNLIIGSLAAGKPMVLACSALKAKYRDALSTGDPRVKFVHLTGPKALIEERLKNRPGHFMPAGLLTSQLDTLEPPKDALVLSCEKTPPELVTEAAQALGIALSV